MIKNFVFDMCNVLILFHPQTIFKDLLNEEEMALVLQNFYNSKEYHEVDRGTMTYSEVMEAMKGRLPGYLIEMLNSMYVEKNFVENFMPPFPEMYDFVKHIKQCGYKVYLLSNAGLDFEYYQQFIPVLSLMDGKIVSSYYKLLKPEREIYETLYNEFNLKPEECVFIDDLQKNIDGAKEAGMDGIVFSPTLEDVSVLAQKLKNKGLKI